MSLTKVVTRNVITTITEEIDGEEVSHDLVEVVTETVDLTPEEEAAVLADWAADDPTTLPNQKKAKKAAASALFEGVFASGYAPTGTMAGETLQVATLIDRTNWLTSMGAYQAAIALGAGAVEGATFRTTANHNFTLTYNEGLQVLLAMAAWGASVYRRLWEIKDAIDAAQDQAALDAIDVTAGWPS